MSAIAIGVDLVEVARVSAMLARHGDAARRRVFTPGEVAYCQPRARRDEHYAARFAAKEAVMKALGTGWARGVAFADIEVLPDEVGRPVLRLTGGARQLAHEMGISGWLVSLSHTRTHAIAAVVALSREGRASVQPPSDAR